MEIGIVSQICELAKTPANRATIVKDQGCLPGLVLFLDNSDVAVVETAVKALYYLAECEDNIVPMRNQLGLDVSLQAILEKESTAHFHGMTRCLLQTLEEEDDSCENDATQMVNREGDGDRVPFTPVQQTPSQSFFRGGINKAARTITLKIDGMNDMNGRALVEEELLSVKGIISFTFDMKASRVVVRSRNEVTVEALCAAVAHTKTMTASQVVKNENGQEVYLTFGRSPRSTATPSRVPDYLDDDDEYIPDAVAEGKAVAQAGVDNAGVGGWFTSAVGYLSKSLYW